MNLSAIQTALREQELDGWLFFDHHGRDPLAARVLGLPQGRMASRRWYYFIPSAGEPRGLVHRIESGQLDSLPGAKTAYASWQEQAGGLRQLLGGARRVAMQYSPLCAIPYVATVDAGTVELVRSLGVEVVSSAELIQLFEACWPPAALELHLEAGRRVDQVRRDAFQLISDATRADAALTEFAVQQFVLKRFAESGLVTNHGPIVGANAHASDPHYAPSPTDSAALRRGDLVLLDLWAKLPGPDAVYYDVTWMGFCGDDPPEEMRRVFGIVRDARDAAVRLVMESVAAGRALRGFEVDDATRGVITAAGYGEFFPHRTGHSIGREVHGNGANMDNLETHDDRRVIPRTCFSVEPGIYLPRFGVRSEVNVFVDQHAARVTGEIQRDLALL